MKDVQTEQKSGTFPMRDKSFNAKIFLPGSANNHCLF